ncbi:hypothetical protein GALL_112740 [mine drainage metagenome]|uniref:Uncharacterized protein n=1 Tax=mine drainage metagenome TaxID=410659 RepID=A0A1J5SFG6_9ZZZZ
MLIFRLLFVLLVITAMVLFGLYLLAGDQKYLRYFKLVIKYLLFLVIALVVLFVSRRLFFYLEFH